MNTHFLNTRFARIGARLKVADTSFSRFRSSSRVISLDIRSDQKGEFFEIAYPFADDPDIAVLDIQANDRHLLLLVREDDEKSKFLCGHDERHWFVAALPESAPVGNVRQAKEALKPEAVLSAQANKRLSSNASNRRKNTAFLRQGEWFFLPEPSLVPDENLVRRNEPLRRSNSAKPHWAEFCCRTGGQKVFVCSKYRNGITEMQYKKLLAKNSSAKIWGWQTMLRNPSVFVRGRISHQDHATIMLRCWHRVVMNTEAQSKAMKNVAFLD